MSSWKRKQTPFKKASGEIVFSRESLVLLVKGDGKLEDILDWETFQMMDRECHSKQWKVWWSKDSCRVVSDFRAYTVPHGGRIRDNM